MLLILRLKSEAFFSLVSLLGTSLPPVNLAITAYLMVFCTVSGDCPFNGRAGREKGYNIGNPDVAIASTRNSFRFFLHSNSNAIVGE